MIILQKLPEKRKQSNTQQNIFCKSRSPLTRRFSLLLLLVASVAGSLKADTIVALKQQPWHTASQISQVIVAKSVADRVGYIIATDQAKKESQIQKSLIVTTVEIPELALPSNLVEDSDLYPYIKTEETLLKIGTLDPKIKAKVAPYLAKYNSVIKPEVERYKNGEKKRQNVWYSAGDYAAKTIKDKAAEETEKQKLKEQTEENRIKAEEIRVKAEENRIQAEVEERARQRQANLQRVKNAPNFGSFCLTPKEWAPHLRGKTKTEVVEMLGKPDDTTGSWTWNNRAINPDTGKVTYLRIKWQYPDVVWLLDASGSIVVPENEK